MADETIHSGNNQRRRLGRRRLIGGLAGGLGSWLLAGCAEPPLVGTDLGQTPAPDFSLSDQTGQRISLSALRDKVIVLTFLYTACPDICPLTAAKLRQVREALGRAAERLALLVVSVDPVRDQPAVVQEYSDRFGLTGLWHFLIGERAELARVWAAYGIAVLPGPGGTINHTDALFLIDRQGRQRVLLRTSVEPADLEGNLRRLLR